MSLLITTIIQHYILITSNMCPQSHMKASLCILFESYTHILDENRMYSKILFDILHERFE